MDLQWGDKHTGFALPGANTRLDKYLQTREQGDLSAPFLCDLSQDGGTPTRGRSGPWVPTLARSSIICSCSKRVCGQDHHILTPNEIEFSQGWPTIPSSSPARRALLTKKFLTLSIHQRSHLVGNGVHLTPMTAWLLYVKSHLLLRESVKLIVPPSLCEDRDSDDDD